MQTCRRKAFSLWVWRPCLASGCCRRAVSARVQALVGGPSRPASPTGWKACATSWVGGKASDYEGNPRVVLKEAGAVGFGTLLCTVGS